MVHRIPGNRTIVALLALLAGACGESSDTPLELGSPSPLEWSGSGADGRALRPYIVWMATAEDCFSCQAFDYQVRRLQEEFGEALAFTLVHVGPPNDSTVPLNFLRDRRVRIDHVVSLTHAELRATGKASWYLPGLYAVSAGRVVWAASPDETLNPDRPLSSVVTDLVATSNHQ